MFQSPRAARSGIVGFLGTLCARHARSTVESSRADSARAEMCSRRRPRSRAWPHGCRFNHWEFAGTIAGVCAARRECPSPLFRAEVLRCALQRSEVARGPRGSVNTTVNRCRLHGRRAARRRSGSRLPRITGGPASSSWTIVQLRWGSSGRRRPPSLVKTEAVRDDCDMEHRMSDAELRKAIRVLRERADDARHRGNDDDANGIERTIRTYQEEMTQRL